MPDTAGTSAEDAREPAVSGRMHFRGEGMDAISGRLAGMSQGTGVQLLVPEDADSYMYVLETLLLEGVTHANGVGARHLFCSSTDEHGARKYGARYSDLFNSVPHMSFDYATRTVRASGAAPGARRVYLAPTSPYSNADVALAQATMAHCVPIPPNPAPPAWWDEAASSALGLPPPSLSDVRAGERAIRLVRGALEEAKVPLLPWSEAPSALPSAVVVYADLGNQKFCSELGREVAAGLRAERTRGRALAACLRPECVNLGLWEAHLKFVEASR